MDLQPQNQPYHQTATVDDVAILDGIGFFQQRPGQIRLHPQRLHPRSDRYRKPQRPYGLCDHVDAQTVGTGRIEAGTVHVNDKVEIVGIKDTIETVCTGVEMFNKLLDSGQAGDNIGTLLRAARDFQESNPPFALQAAIAALRWMAAGRFYELRAGDVWDARRFALETAEATGQSETIQAFLDELTASPATDAFVRQQLESPYGVRRPPPPDRPSCLGRTKRTRRRHQSR